MIAQVRKCGTLGVVARAIAGQLMLEGVQAALILNPGFGDLAHITYCLGQPGKLVIKASRQLVKAGAAASLYRRG
ncbi:MAG: hypothetical protein Rhims3KO_03740 [Hyphomicrobiales bacterium]